MRPIRQAGGRMSDVIGNLTAEQALKIVKRLCREQGELQDAIVAEAMNVLADFSLDAIADAVFDLLDVIDIQDCWDRAGGSHNGYTSPEDAALDLIEETLQPFFDQVERYRELNMPEQEAAYCQGVMLGIYRFEQEARSDFKQVAEDIPAESARFLLNGWRERNPEKARIDAMYAFFRKRCPKWAPWLKEG
jgi:hypothetical protein